MISKIANFVKWKKWLIITACILSFALLKSFNVIATNSVNGIFLSALLIIGNGIFYWLIFEVLVGFLYSGLKIKIEKNITISQFNNIFRFFIIFFNFFIYFSTKIFILINFYANFLILIFNLIILLAFFIVIWQVLKKKFLFECANKSLELTYFSFAFMYLFLHTIMWGALW